MTTYDAAFVEACVRGLRAPGSTTAKGRRLQDLVEYLVAEVPGTGVHDRNAHDAAGSREIDLWLRHDLRVSGLPFADLLVPIECKNEDSPASAADVSRLETKVRDSGGSDGLLVARAGLAGPTHTRSAHDAIHLALSHGVRILVLVGDDFERIRTADELRDLLVDRHLELRQQGTYLSI